MFFLFLQNFSSGTTAVCVLLRPKEKTLYVAWAGDSQALLVNQGRVFQCVQSHKPCREVCRFRNIFCSRFTIQIKLFMLILITTFKLKQMWILKTTSMMLLTVFASYFRISFSLCWTISSIFYCCYFCLLHLCLY